jgi:hypothetical protein
MTSSRNERLSTCVKTLLRNPRESVRALTHLPELVRSAGVAREWGTTPHSQRLESCTPARGHDGSLNPLRAYFDAVTEGPGVWKWLHYFELYDRHLRKFVGRHVTVVEVGVYSGGSMPMWRHYFGEGCRVHGVDVQEDCRAYEDSHTTIHIGDQADRVFWKRFRESVPTVDVLIDDGGHQPEQQMVTLEEMLHHLRPGGVYICEDLHGVRNRFAAFAHSLADELNAFTRASPQELASTATPFQAAINSVHLYPFVVVIEKRDSAVKSFLAPKHGTKWQPFL